MRQPANPNSIRANAQTIQMAAVQSLEARQLVRIGYARTSAGREDLDVCIAALEAAGCETIFFDKDPPKSIAQSQLTFACAKLRRGDNLVVWKLVQLGLTITQLSALLERFERDGITLCSLQEGIDHESQIGAAMPRVGALFAAMQRDLRRERTSSGLKTAAVSGRLRGQRPFMSDQMIKRAKKLMTDKSITMRQIAERLGISTNTLYRSLKRAETAGSKSPS